VFRSNEPGNSVLTAAFCQVRRYVESWLVQAKLESAEDTAPEQRFGGVLSRANRYDLYLPLDGPIALALQRCASVLAPFLVDQLGANPELFELSALVRGCIFSM